MEVCDLEVFGICRELRASGLKRYREFMVLGFLALLVATGAAFSSAPAARTDASCTGPTSHKQGAALSDTGQGLVIGNACPFAPNLSRIDQSSPHGIVPQSIVHMPLDTHGLGIADVLAVSAREIGFHSLLRAPPTFLLI
jgi:hypothetical protein